ncbi:hypothetical protein [Oleidesulfovibrio sp.]|uniref:hypothetical protein n=1 Tax=Oleidesulfovibrio sp. TaxID=2909707 RepID=UPI003A89ABA2
MLNLHLPFSLRAVSISLQACRVMVIAILFLLTTHMAASGNVIPAKPEPPKHILLLNSYDQTMNWVKDITSAVETCFADKKLNVILHVENMDTKRVTSHNYYASLKNLLTIKYADLKFAAVITSDDNAFEFA